MKIPSTLWQQLFGKLDLLLVSTSFLQDIIFKFSARFILLLIPEKQFVLSSFHPPPRLIAAICKNKLANFVEEEEEGSERLRRRMLNSMLLYCSVLPYSYTWDAHSDTLSDYQTSPNGFISAKRKLIRTSPLQRCLKRWTLCCINLPSRPEEAKTLDHAT